MEHIARTSKQIGDAVRRHRRKLQVTQKNLGARADLRQATISGLEGGEPGTRIDTLCAVLAALGLELVIRERTTADTKRIEELF
jgi:HTH-type transcriptional regulator/antitoxin HipB